MVGLTYEKNIICYKEYGNNDGWEDSNWIYNKYLETMVV